MIYLKRDVRVPPKTFQDHLRDHPKDQSPAPGKEEPKPKIIFEPSKVAGHLSRDGVKCIIADLEAAELGVKKAAKEVTKVQVEVMVMARS